MKKYKQSQKTDLKTGSFEVSRIETAPQTRTWLVYLNPPQGA